MRILLVVFTFLLLTWHPGQQQSSLSGVNSPHVYQETLNWHGGNTLIQCCSVHEQEASTDSADRSLTQVGDAAATADPGLQYSSASQDVDGVHYHPVDLSDGSLTQPGVLQGGFVSQQNDCL